MIRGDVTAGQVPISVRDFGDLHAFVDANEYLIHAGQAQRSRSGPAFPT